MGTLSAEEYAAFADPKLEQAVIWALHKPAGPVTVAEMESLSSLSAPLAGITSLEGLQHAVNLQMLDLNANFELNDISRVAGLTKLTRLQVGQTGISDLSPVAGLSSLVVLHARGNHLSNLQPLAGLTGLEELDLAWNSIADISPLSGLVNLRKLALYANAIQQDTSPLLSLTQLQSLDIGGMGINDFPWITAERFPNLRAFYCSGSGISDLSFLFHFPPLTTLEFEFNSVANLAPIGGLPLEHLNLAINNIADISVLRSMTSLKSVRMINNWLDVSSESPSGQVIQELLARGVSLDYQPQNFPVAANLDALPARFVFAGQSLPIAFTAGDPNRAGDIAAIEVVCSTPSLLASGGLQVSGSGPSRTLSVAAAAGQSGSGTITLKVSYSTGEPLIVSGSFGLTVLPADGSVFIREVYSAIPGTSTERLPMLVRQPSFAETLTSFETPQHAADNYGQRVYGFVVPPVAGDYVFYIASDDASDLFLSGDASPANKRLVAAELGWNAPRRWSSAPKSAPVSLVAGQPYYMEAWHKEGGGGDNLAVTWQLPGAPAPTDGSPPLPAASKPVAFADPKLEQAVLWALHKQAGPVTVAEMESLSSLSAPQAGITSLEGLQHAVNLQMLDLGANFQLKDIGRVAGLTRLTRLQVGQTGISDLSPVAGLSSLVVLHAGGNHLSNLQPLAGLTGLEELDLAWNSITDISPLSGLVNLRKLALYANAIQQDTSPLLSLTQLQSLDIGGMGINDFPWITAERFPNLRAFYCSGSGISDLSFLFHFPPLTTLEFEHNNVANLAPIGGLPLEHVNLAINNIADISVLRSMTSLKSVRMIKNWLDVSSESPSGQVIQELLARGVSLDYQPQNFPVAANLDALPARFVFAGQSLPIAFTAGDPNRAGDIAAIEVVCSTPSLLASGGLQVSGSGPSRTLSVAAAAGQSGSGTITLKVSYSTGEPLIVSGSFALTVLPADGSVFIREVYSDIPGPNAERLPMLIKQPSFAETLTSFETPQNVADNYGQRVYGFVVTPVTGDYVFYTASDDASDLFLSSDASPANKMLVAAELGWNAPRRWSSAPKSAPVSLVAGQPYYIEAWQKDGIGGDNLAVTWQLPGAPAPTDGDPPLPQLPASMGLLPSLVMLASETVVTRTFTAADPSRADDVVSVTATSADPAILAGGNLVVVGSGLVRQLQVTAGVKSGTTTVTLTTHYGSGLPTSGSFQVDVIGADALYVEAEDFDFGGGQHMPAADAIPYAGGAYEGLGATHDIDYHNDAGAPTPDAYRVGENPAVGVLPCSDNSRGTYSAGNDYLVGYNEPGEWYNYTRNFKPGLYRVYARLASGLGDEHAQLELVTAGFGTPHQTLSPLGTFDAPATGDWGVFGHVPLRTATHETAVLFLSGLHTVRYSLVSGNADPNYLAFVPCAPTGPAPAIVSVEWLNGSVLISFDQAVDPVTAGDARNYQVAGASLAGISLVGGHQVLLQLSGLAGTEVTVTLAGVFGLNGAKLGSASFALMPSPVLRVDTIDAFASEAGADQGLFSISISGDRSQPVTVQFALSGSAAYGVDYQPIPTTVTIPAGRSSVTIPIKPIPNEQVDGYRTVSITLSPLEGAELQNASATLGLFDDNEIPNGLLREVYAGIEGWSLADLAAARGFLSQPTAADVVSSLESPQLGNNYGERLSGYLTAPQTGEYVFYLAADDQAGIWLSTDADPAHKSLIAFEPGWSFPRDWTGTAQRNPEAPENRSAPIPLLAGQSYYVEVLHQQGAGAGHVAVAWQLPGAQVPAYGSEPIGGQYLSVRVPLSVSELNPAGVRSGGPDFTLAVKGAGFLDGAQVLWQGTPRPTAYVGPRELAATIFAADIASNLEIQTATITVQNPGGELSNPAAFTIGSAAVAVADSTVAPAGGTVVVSTAPTQESGSGEAGVSATFNNSADDSTVTVTAASYSTNPNPGTLFDTGAGFVDLQVTGASPTDSMSADFYYPAAITSSTEDSLVLLYYDGGEWNPVRGSSGVDPVKDTTDNLDGTVSGGRFSVLFDESSTPRITELRGTVFAPAPEAVAADKTEPVPDIDPLPVVRGQCSVTVSPPTATDAVTGKVIGQTSDPLTYSVPGAHTILWTYSDGNGNVATQEQTVYVEPPSFQGFLAPLKGADSTGGSEDYPLLTAQLGSTIPVKFTLTCNGTPNLTAAVHKLEVKRAGYSQTYPFRLSEGLWIVDWKTKGLAAGTYQLIARLADGQTHQACVKLVKE